MSIMITCREFEAFILDYLEGALPWPQRVVFNLHLSMCSECRRYLSAYRQATQLGRVVLTADEGPVPASVPDDLVVAVMDALSVRSEDD